MVINLTWGQNCNGVYESLKYKIAAWRRPADIKKKDFSTEKCSGRE